MRFLGGTTNHWGGHCAPMAAIDFERRPWIEHSGWPFGLDELAPYYARAHDVLEIGPFSYDPRPVAARHGASPMPLAGPVETTLSRYHRQRFGIRYAQALDDAPNVDVYLYATVTALTLDESGSRVGRAVVRTLAGNTVGVRARRWVLAAGGIENARLLLDSDAGNPAGLGNSRRLVGRYFNEHISYYSGLLLPRDGRLEPFYLEEQLVPGEVDRRVRLHLALTAEATRRLRIPKFRAELVASSELLQSFEDVREQSFAFADLRAVMARPRAFYHHLRWRVRPEADAYLLNNYVEQIPNPESSVSLSQTRNALGQRIARLDWRLLPGDKRGIRIAHEAIAREAGRSGFGRFRIDMPEDDAEEMLLEGAVGGFHHMGTTRMSDDPARGVVDRNCRMHEVANLYVAGSSVFPAAGWPNPTLTIVALAERLADHLSGELARER